MIHSTTGVFLLLTGAAWAQQDAGLADDGPTLESLDRRERILERTLELQAEAAAEKARASPEFGIGPNGLTARTADGSFSVRVHGLLQLDGRTFFSAALPSNFEVRRARPILDAAFLQLVDVRVMPEFGEGRAQLFDAYADLHPAPWLRLRAGKFKPPLGFERQQTDASRLFLEFSEPSNLLATRDVGVQLWGELGGGRLTYALGIFDGVPDSGNGDVDLTDGKDVAAQLTAQPFNRTGIPVLQGFGFGVGASYGSQTGTAAAPNLATYRSPGTQTSFSFVPDAVAAGDHSRVVPHVRLHAGPVEVLAEYAYSQQLVGRGTDTVVSANHAFVLQAGWVVTGEAATFDGLVPAHDIDPGAGHFGAVQVGVRYQELRINGATFAGFADPSKSASASRSAGGVVHWALTQSVRGSVSFERSWFEGGAPGGGNRAPESALFARLQANF